MSLFSLLSNKQKNKHLFALALPMILSNITIPLLGLVDTGVIGHLSNAYYLGGVALGATMISVMLFLLGFLRMATTGLVAQAYGADDKQQQYQLLFQSTSLALLLGLLAVLFQSPIAKLSIYLSSPSLEVAKYCQEYFSIRIWSTPFALLNLALLGWLLGIQKPKAAMLQLILANSVNITLDLFFVLGLGWGVKGVALASVFADISGFILAISLVWHHLHQDKQFHLTTLFSHLKISSYKALLSLNTDIFLRSLCLQLVFTFVTFHSASLGDNILAANAVLLNLVMLISYALDGIAYYAEAEVGRAYGEKNHQRLQDTVALAWAWCAIVAIGFVFAFLLAGTSMVHTLTNIHTVQDMAQQYLPWVIFFPLLAFSSYLFDGVYIGAAKGKVMRNSMLICTFMVFFPMWFLLGAEENYALWAALSAFMLARSVTLGIHYHFKFKHFQ
ncbi:MATE family efflux transporter [Shewanella surugensis]|uniref:MATE family efflux transporter n=1 Tax=Shewanella surugensis TaxID=212020 RepID=A0ABT0LGI3_9GAMM|nr:MATE family efflux transporter [Shewanella surugensis]MCL1126799.1 MATE family efflux transporter [Shewanella surugensis]